MNKERFITLYIRTISGEITPSEKEELEQLKAENPGYASLQQVIENISFEEIPKEAAGNSRYEALYKKIEAKLIQPAGNRKKRPAIHYRWWAAAAVVIGILFSVFLFSDKGNKQSLSEHIIATQKGSKSNIVLPDGTKVWINADSKLSYPEKFDTPNREVQLTGEAYFEVTKDAQHPFIVHTENIDIKVLGTEFNVRAYDNESNTQTTLLKGAVEVSIKNDNDKKVMLSPNEKLITPNKPQVKKAAEQKYKEQEHQPEVVMIQHDSKDSSVYETGWMYNRLVFNSEKIEDIILVLERWYNTPIVFKGKPTGKTFTGSFKGASLEEVLKTLKISAGVNYKNENGKIEIY